MNLRQNGQHCGDASCSHTHGASPDGEVEDFNEMLEETHPCCQKDAAARERGLKVRAALDRVDPSQIAERARKAAFSLGGATSESLPSHGGDGDGAADYPALAEARRNAPQDHHRGGGEASAAGETRRYCIIDNDRTREHDDYDDDADEDDDDLDYLLDDPELLRMEQARVEGMQADAARIETLRALGFGIHVEVAESKLEATVAGQFRGAGVVVHFFDPDSRLSASLDLLLEKRAGSFMGTRFVRCRLRPSSPVASKMRVHRVPSLACYKGGVRVALSEGLVDFGDADGVDPGAVDRWLGASGTLEFDPPSLNAVRDNGLEGASRVEGDSDDDLGEWSASARFDCGLDGCQKTFAHNHFLAAGGGGLPQGFDLPL